MQRVHIIIHGSVQGVFFRANAKKIADSLGLNGYAKNMDDGTMEVVAQGPIEKLKELIEYCKKGPEMSKVSKIDFKFEKAKSGFDGFEVRI